MCEHVFWKDNKTLAPKSVIVRGFSTLTFTATSEMLDMTFASFLGASLYQKCHIDTIYGHRHWWFSINIWKMTKTSFLISCGKSMGNLAKCPNFSQFWLFLAIYSCLLSGFFIGLEMKKHLVMYTSRMRQIRQKCQNGYFWSDVEVEMRSHQQVFFLTCRGLGATWAPLFKWFFKWLDFTKEFLPK